MESDPRTNVAELIVGSWKSHILYAGVELGIFEALENGQKSASEVANRLSLDTALGYRLLRALASIELLEEQKDRMFRLTPEGRFLLKDHPESLAAVALLEEGPEHYALWKHLPAMIRDGGQNAFVREFGRTAFQHADQDPGYGSVFNQAMNSYSAVQTKAALEALETFDFRSVRTICDIGGGQGHLLCGFLAQHPHLTGLVLERPSVIQAPERLWANRLGLGDRCRYVVGNMFEAVPSADVYLMKLIIHDWDDRGSVKILAAARRAAPANARLFIIEHIIPGPDASHFSKLYDIHMMCWGTGRERTREEYAALLAAAGWSFQGIRPMLGGLMGIVEAINLAV